MAARLSSRRIGRITVMFWLCMAPLLYSDATLFGDGRLARSQRTRHR